MPRKAKRSIMMPATMAALSAERRISFRVMSRVRLRKTGMPPKLFITTKSMTKALRRSGNIQERMRKKEVYKGGGYLILK